VGYALLLTWHDVRSLRSCCRRCRDRRRGKAILSERIPATMRSRAVVGGGGGEEDEDEEVAKWSMCWRRRWAAEACGAEPLAPVSRGGSVRQTDAMLAMRVPT
jgi:hypothetical protein